MPKAVGKGGYTRFQDFLYDVAYWIVHDDGGKGKYRENAAEAARAQVEKHAFWKSSMQGKFREEHRSMFAGWIAEGLSEWFGGGDERVLVETVQAMSRNDVKPARGELKVVLEAAEQDALEDLGN